MTTYCLNKNQSLPAVPWFWSGWAQELSEKKEAEVVADFGGSLEGLEGKNLWVGLPTADKERLSQAMKIGACRVLTAFLPDEVDDLWTPEERQFLLERAIFLPPKVVLPAKVGAKISKTLLLTDRPALDVLRVEPRPIHTDKSAPVYPAFELPTRAMDRLFVRRAIASVDDVAECLMAPGWVLSCQSPQVEHALWMVAANYGMKVGFWERSGGCALRMTLGYNAYKKSSESGSIRRKVQQIATLVSPPKLTNTLMPRWEDLEMWTWSKLGFGSGYTSWSALAQKDFPAALEGAFDGMTLKRLGNPFFRSSVVLAIERSQQKDSKELVGLWNLLLLDCLFFAPEAIGVYALGQMMKRWGDIVYELIVNAMREFSASGPHSGAIVTRLIRLLEKNILETSLAQRLARAILSYEKSWMRAFSDKGWYNKFLAHAILGESPEKYLPANYDEDKSICGGYAAWVVWRLKNRTPLDETLLAYLDRDIDRIPTEAWLVLLPHLMELPVERFGKYFEAGCQRLTPWVAMAHSVWMSNYFCPQWVKSRADNFSYLWQQVGPLAEKEPRNVFFGWLLRCWSGQSVPVEEFCRTGEKEWTSLWRISGMWLMSLDDKKTVPDLWDGVDMNNVSEVWLLEGVVVAMRTKNVHRMRMVLDFLKAKQRGGGGLYAYDFDRWMYLFGAVARVMGWETLEAAARQKLTESGAVIRLGGVDSFVPRSINSDGWDEIRQWIEAVFARV